MYMSFGTLIVVLIASTPGAGGSRTRKRTGIAKADETPIVPGLKDPPGAIGGGPSIMLGVGGGSGGGGGGASVSATTGLRFGAARTREGRRWIWACFTSLSLTEARGRERGGGSRTMATNLEEGSL